MNFNKYRTKKIVHMIVPNLDTIIQVRILRRKLSIDPTASRVFLWKTIHAGFVRKPGMTVLTMTDWRKFRSTYLARKKRKVLWPARVRQRL